jgi:hypothetical protein
VTEGSGGFLFAQYAKYAIISQRPVGLLKKPWKIYISSLSKRIL